MEKKFYREKNALSIAGAKIITPSKDEIEGLLINKLQEKTAHMIVVHNKELRDKYLAGKNKLEEARELGDQETEKMLVLRLAADLLQLVLDLAKVYRAKVELVNKEQTSISTSDIQKELVWCCEKIQTKQHKDKILDVIIHLIYAYIDDFGITMNDVVAEREKIEEAEGNFFNGKVVVF